MEKERKKHNPEGGVCVSFFHVKAVEVYRLIQWGSMVVVVPRTERSSLELLLLYLAEVGLVSAASRHSTVIPQNWKTPSVCEI